ncbi:MAG: hypothetical protein ACYDDF_01230 [Thermoplasmatota archaeon]
MRGLPVAVIVLLSTTAFAGCVTLPSGQTLTTSSLGQKLLSGNLTPTQAALFSLPGGIPIAAPVGSAAAVGEGLLTGFGAGEPTMGIDAHGNVYFVGMVQPHNQLTTIELPVGASKAQDIGPAIAGQHVDQTSLDPYLYVDPATGRVYLSNNLGQCMELSWTDDQGKTWVTQPEACGTPWAIHDHQTMVAAKARMLKTVGYPNILYECFNDILDTSCTTSLDGGLTWGPQIPALSPRTPGVSGLNDPTNPGVDICSSLQGHLKAGPDGYVYLPSRACPGQSSPPVVAVTGTDGLNWTTHVISDTVFADDSHDVALAIDASNTLYALWGHQGHLVLAYSKDHANTWSRPVNVTAPGVTATMFMAMDAGLAGKIAFSYIGTTIPGGYSNKTLQGNTTCSDPPLNQQCTTADGPAWANATWNAYMGVITNATSQDPVIQTVTINNPSTPIARGTCGRTRCNGMYDFIDLSIDKNGRPWSIYVDVCTQKCATDPKAHDDTPMGLLGTLETGPSLLGNGTALAPLVFAANGTAPSPASSSGLPAVDLPAVTGNLPSYP